MNRNRSHVLPARRVRRPAFSLVELLIAVTISSTLLAACLAALDASFKSYKATTESAAVNVTTRLTMHRLTALIRNGDNFGPFPVNPRTTPQITANEIEFLSTIDETQQQLWRVRRVAQAGELGPYRLEARVETFTRANAGESWVSGGVIEQNMLYRVRDAVFILEYDYSRRLRRATIDLTVGPHDDAADRITTDLETPLIRMVSSVRPRRLSIGD